MSTTPNLELPYILPQQAQKHVTHNEALRSLDMLTQIAIVDRDLTAPPASPVEGSRYIVASGASGAWAGRSGQIAAWQDGAWIYRAPKTGWLAWVVDENRLLAFDGAAWQPIPASALENLAMVGINATADAANRLSVSAAATLLSHQGNGHQLKLNKAAASDTASLLLQTAFSSRAEIGLAGNDDLAVKVSADGSAWATAFSIDRSTGQATFPLGSGRVQVDNLVASGTWSKPAWARQVQVILVGGGGGGGSGRRGAAASDRRGGGGGGAGGRSIELFLADDLLSSMTVTIGTGGAGGGAVTTDNTNGTAGATGGLTSLSAAGIDYLAATGGSGGFGGTATTTNGGAGGAGSGLPGHAGGAGGGTTGGTGGLAGDLHGPGSAGGGGGISAANAIGNGGTGRPGYQVAAADDRRGLPGAGGVAGAVGVAGGIKGWSRGAGGGGGGGASGNAAATAAGAVGGAGGTAGGAGGGGGASTNGAVSGIGGDGGPGEAWFISTG